MARHRRVHFPKFSTFLRDHPDKDDKASSPPIFTARGGVENLTDSRDLFLVGNFFQHMSTSKLQMREPRSACSEEKLYL